MEKEWTRNTKERVRRGLLWDQIRGLDVGATKFNSELSHFVPHLNRFVFFFFWNETRIPLPIPKCTMHLCFFRKLFRSIGMDMSIKRVDWIRERKSSFGGESSFQSWLLWLLRAAYTGFSVGNTFFFFFKGRSLWWWRKLFSFIAMIVYTFFVLLVHFCVAAKNVREYLVQVWSPSLKKSSYAIWLFFIEI